MHENETIGELLSKATQRLCAKSETGALEAQVLLGHVLGRSRTWVLAHTEIATDAAQRQAYAEAVSQAEAGVPLAYLTGVQEFYGIPFSVNSDVLIPRPETEQLIDLALEWLAANPDKRMAADVGTGSGCIAVTLARHCRDLRLTAMDISEGALRTARRNAICQGVAERMRFVQSDLLSALQGNFDLICANLPYGSKANLPPPAPVGVKAEPRLAIEGGEDGMDLIRRFLGQAPQRLAQGGMLLMEIEAFQGRAVAAHARTAFPDAQVDVLQDLAGLDRIVRVLKQT